MEIKVRRLDEGPFKASVRKMIRAVPPGRVITPESIAVSLGYSEAAADLVSFVVDADDADTPWHRVVTSDGTLPGRKGGHVIEQANLLALEGVDILPGPRVDLQSVAFEFEASSTRGPLVSRR